jgi:hypothetical protein
MLGLNHICHNLTLFDLCNIPLDDYWNITRQTCQMTKYLRRIRMMEMFITK